MALIVGDTISNISIPDLNGEVHNLNDFKSKHMLLEFWSMSCFSCMNVAREIKALHQQYADKVSFININMDTERAMWEQGSTRDGITWTNLSDGKGTTEGIGSIFGVIGFPSFVLADANGLIKDRWMGFKPGKVEEKLKTLVV